MLFVTLSRDSDEAEIRQLVKDFAVATDYTDTRTIVSLLCTEEAEGITESGSYDPDDPNAMGPVVMPEDWRPPLVETSEVHVFAGEPAQLRGDGLVGVSPAFHGLLRAGGATPTD
jgi:hypothetical protein